ncbi:hypothetical protein [Salipiger mangrovisoli]|uniref:Uncharacterized protein n=1 Tax=Salipiger mangrovisoli TaxID=2865933 RepID=A0ABR9X7J7_9RHOB|nr:hypothetical protein [Salipiger mangrovisoli]MBE9639466.1 hypothetical protein [Salipiger mangrovisoli]
MNLSPLVLAMTLVPGLANAASCPTSADLDTGIRLRGAEGASELFTRQGPALVRSVYEQDGVAVTRTLLGSGLYVLETLDLEDGAPVPETRTTFGFPMPPAAMPMPKPAGSWTVKVTVTEAGRLGTEVQSYRFGPETEITFGACTYDMIPIIQHYDDETIDYVTWLPELGLSFLSGFSDTEGQERYDYFAIEAVR